MDHRPMLIFRMATPRTLGRLRCFALLLIACTSLQAQPHDGTTDISFVMGDGRVQISVSGQRIGSYVWDDPATPRPYFSNLCALGGDQVTRSHPPDPAINKNNDDHETYHPGVWLAFGDMNGLDFWRNKARVRHVKFVQLPEGRMGNGAFTVLNAYEPVEIGSKPVAMEACTYFFHVMPIGYLLIARSTFWSDSNDIEFGDQEEMGFGVRMQTPLTVRLGSGTIRNSEGGLNEAGTWGREAKWCSFSGTTKTGTLGLMLMPGPDNFRPSWFHSRDYGLMVANPFGRKSMTGPNDPGVKPDRTTVERGRPFTLTFGLCVFSSPGSESVDYDLIYQTFLDYLKTDPAPAVP